MVDYNREWFRNNYEVSDENSHNLLIGYLRKYYQLNEETIKMSSEYLLDRKNEMENKDIFGVVYDITYLCNLNCLHCGVNAKCVRDVDKHLYYEKNFDEVIVILEKIHNYIKTRNIKCYFLMFGGGEPFIRKDIKEILKYASTLFGSENIGINTNGTICGIEDLDEIKDFVGTIEISLDGFKDYHNEWRKTSKNSFIQDPFTRTSELIKESTKRTSLKSKIEVSSMITKDNLKDFPDFVNFLSGNGVENFSAHRPMPVGRLENHLDKIPSFQEFLQLLLHVAKLRNTLKPKMNDLHIHHSLESIFSVMFLGSDIFQSENIMSSKRHSIGIDPYGNVYMDPWCMVPPYNKLKGGNLFTNQTLEKIIHSKDSIISIADEITKQSNRCAQCRLPCSGGMRFNALASYISNIRKSGITEITDSHLIIGLSKIDPACPLFDSV